MKRYPDNKLDKLKIWFIRLGFWKKLILILTINTIVILLVMNVLMIILINGVSDDIVKLVDKQQSNFTALSNLQVAHSAAKRYLKGIQIFSTYIKDVVNSFYYFSNNSETFISLQSGVNPYNPPLTTQFTTPSWQRTGIYFFNQNSTFHNDPYVDVFLAHIFTNKQTKQIKRMNVIYQSDTDSSDIFARTIPGDPNFTIPSAQEITSRMQGLTQNYFSLTSKYNDTLTLSIDDVQQLFSLRSIIKLDNGFSALIELEVFQKTSQWFLSQLYFLPSAHLIFFKIMSQSPPKYQLLNIDYFEINLTQCFEIGSHQLSYQNGTIVDAQSVGFNQSFLLGENLLFSNLPSSNYRLVLLVNKDEVSVPQKFMQDFLQNQQQSLFILIGIWSAVILFCTISLSIVAGNYIFHNLKTLAEKLHEYTKNPKMMHKIIFALKELETTGVIKKLIDNTITIIEKIEERKKLKNNVIKPIQFPLSLSQFNFLNKHGIKDQEKLENIKKIISKQIKKRQSTILK